MKSMTGFGRGSASSDQFYAAFEISSVNRKQLDVRFSAPKEALFLDSMIRKKVSEKLTRGSVQVSINFRILDSSFQSISINESLIEQYKNELTKVQQKFSIAGEVTLDQLLALPDVFSESQTSLPVADVWTVVEQALEQALNHLIDNRNQEGLALQNDFILRQANLSGVFSGIEKQAPQVKQNYQEKLLSRLQEAGLPIDLEDERLLKEIAIFADKSDISEELVRLIAHLEKFTELIHKQEAVGRELDFLMQECSREINTIGSKASDQLINQAVVSFKAELERCREQIQNVE